MPSKGFSGEPLGVALFVHLFSMLLLLGDMNKRRTDSNIALKEATESPNKGTQMPTV